MTVRILVYMPKYQRGFETRLFGVVRELRNRGYHVDFRIATTGLLREGHSSMPGVPDEVLAREDFLEHHAKPVASLSDFYRATLNADIVITGNALKGMKHIEGIIHRLGKPYVICDDTNDVLLSSYMADIVAVPALVHKEFLVANGLVPSERILVTGPLHLNECRHERHNPSWDLFCERYSLDPNKKIALISTSAAQRQEEWTKRYQQSLVKMVQESAQFQPLLRLHPNDSSGHKRIYTWSDTSKDSADQLYPNVSKIDPEDRIAAMNLSSLLITIESMTVMETSLFRMNGLMVGHWEQWLKANYRDCKLLPAKRHTKFGTASLEKTPLVDELLRSGKLTRNGLFSGRFRHEFPFTWIGSICSDEELPGLLETDEVLKVDEEDRSQHMKAYWHSEDGKAHFRVADAVDMVRNDPRLVEKLYRGRGKRLWQLTNYGLWQTMQPVTSPNTPPRKLVRIVKRRFKGEIGR